MTSALEVLERHLQQRDATTKTWASLIAPTFAHWSRSIPVDLIVDWIYYTEEPVNVFDFLSWAHAQEKPKLRLLRKAAPR